MKRIILSHLLACQPRPNGPPRATGAKARLVALLASITACFLLASPAQAALLGRDLSGAAIAATDDRAVFFYDTDLNITWLRDANASATAGNTNDPYNQGFGGFMNWGAANTWANTLTVGAFSGWRLPAEVNRDAACTYQSNFSEPNLGQTSEDYNCTGGEMGHLWYTELGNTAGSVISNTGNFQNLTRLSYFSGAAYPYLLTSTEYADPFPAAWSFLMRIGYKSFDDQNDELLAMAVRNGDVLTDGDAGTVPEPQSLLLTLLGLTGLGLVRRRRSI